MPAAGIVLIRGAGPVGCVAGLALRDSKKVRIAGKDSAVASFRPIVLSYASRLILERLGVWAALSPARVRTIHVSQVGGFGRTVFEAADCAVPALGYVLEYSVLLEALRSAAKELFTDEALSARCVVHAEGAAPDAQEKRYARDALVASVRCAPPAADTAFERFAGEGPLALLPLAGRYAAVWSMHPERARRLAAAESSGSSRARPARARSNHWCCGSGKARSPKERCTSEMLAGARGREFVGVHHFGFLVDDVAATQAAIGRPAGKHWMGEAKKDGGFYEMKFYDPGIAFDITANGWAGAHD